MTGTEVQELRKRLKLTQEELSRRLGVTVSTVNRWERGHAAPSHLAVESLKRLIEGGTAVDPPVVTGMQVRALRQKLGLTQEAMAAECGVTFSTLSRWENAHVGLSRLAAEKVARLADTRGVAL